MCNLLRADASHRSSQILFSTVIALSRPVKISSTNELRKYRFLRGEEENYRNNDMQRLKKNLTFHNFTIRKILLAKLTMNIIETKGKTYYMLVHFHRINFTSFSSTVPVSNHPCSSLFKKKKKKKETCRLCKKEINYSNKEEKKRIFATTFLN